METEQEKDKMKELFWEQFPDGTEEFAYIVEEYILQAMCEKGKEEIPLVEMHSAVGIAVGHLLQTTCQYYGYVGEKQIKDLLYGALKKSFDYYKKNPTLP